MLKQVYAIQWELKKIMYALGISSANLVLHGFFGYFVM